MWTQTARPSVREPVLIQAPVPVHRGARGDRLAAWWLAGPLTVAFVGFALAVLAFWLPAYLAWPLWADHDVFAVLAQAWSAGELPYRDRPTTNFPGPIYQAWVFGQIGGWGNTVLVYGFDAALLAALAVASVAWSRVRFGRFLPGAVAAAMLVSYGASQDFARAAQRDGQATAWILLALLAVAGRARPRASIPLSAAAYAFAVVCRPQAVLFLPAMAAALAPLGGARLVVRWFLVFAPCAGALFLPLVWNGLVGDFLRELGRIGEGGIYAHVAKDHLAIQSEQLLSGGMPAAILLAALLLHRDAALPAWPFVALAGAWFYRPLSPFPHGYLEQPLHLALAPFVLVLLGSAMNAIRSPKRQLLAVLAIAASAIEFRPRCCEFRKIGKAWKYLNTGDTHRYVPKGYTKDSIPGQHIYPWHEYHALIEYLRTRTPPDAPVANLLLAPTALNGTLGRRTPLHAESMMWLIIVGRQEHGSFAREIAACPDAVVVWRPAEWALVPEWAVLPDTVRACCRPIATFGDIEVWERKPHDDAATPP